jgi:hypothetical protein
VDVISDNEVYIGTGLDAGVEGGAYNESLDLSGLPLCNSAASCATYIPNLPTTGCVLASGVLPAGLSIVNCRISGTPVAESSGNYSFVVCSSKGCSQYFLTIQPENAAGLLTFGGVLRRLRSLNQKNVVARRQSWVQVEGAVTFQ